MRLPKILRMAVLSALVMGSRLPSAASAEFTCPVTQPAPLDFDPGGTFAGHARELLGTAALFTVFPGVWDLARPDSKRPGIPGYVIPKIVWGSNVFNPDDTLTITGYRLDAPSGPLEFKGASVAQVDGGRFITSSVSVPTPGCWNVTGHFHGTDLNIVVDLK